MHTHRMEVMAVLSAPDGSAPRFRPAGTPGRHPPSTRGHRGLSLVSTRRASRSSMWRPPASRPRTSASSRWVWCCSIRTGGRRGPSAPWSTPGGTPAPPISTASRRRCWPGRPPSRPSIPTWPTGCRAGWWSATTSTASTSASCGPSAAGPAAGPGAWAGSLGRHPGRGPGPPRPAGEGPAGRLLHPLRAVLGRPPQRPGRRPGDRGPVPVDAGRAGRRHAGDRRAPGAGLRFEVARPVRPSPCGPPPAAGCRPPRARRSRRCQARNRSVSRPSRRPGACRRGRGWPRPPRSLLRPEPGRRLGAGRRASPRGRRRPWVPATSGDRARMTTPATSTAKARISRDTHSGPDRRWSANRVMPRTMLTRGLMVTMVVREAVIGPGVQGVLDQEHRARCR